MSEPERYPEGTLVRITDPESINLQSYWEDTIVEVTEKETLAYSLYTMWAETIQIVDAGERHLQRGTRIKITKEAVRPVEVKQESIEHESTIIT